MLLEQSFGVHYLLEILPLDIDNGLCNQCVMYIDKHIVYRFFFFFFLHIRKDADYFFRFYITSGRFGIRIF